VDGHVIQDTEFVPAHCTNPQVGRSVWIRMNDKVLSAAAELPGDLRSHLEQCMACAAHWAPNGQGYKVRKSYGPHVHPV